MTQEEKKILFKDLCARLPYGVKCRCDGNKQIYTFQYEFLPQFDDFPLYLRPMSSMTEKENEELKYVIELGLQALEGEEGHNTVSAAPAAFEIDFYNKHHFDYRGLIPMGLALEAPEDMYKQ